MECHPFDYAHLLPELQVMVRSMSTDTARAMLSMTCRNEHNYPSHPKDRTHLFLAVALEGDPQGWLCDWLFALKEGECCEHTERIWRHHELIEACIRGGHLELLHAVYQADHGSGLSIVQACRRCVQLAVTTGNHLLVHYVIQRCDSHKWGSTPRVTGVEVATVEAIRCNNVALLTFLQQDVYLEWDIDFSWDLAVCDVPPGRLLTECEEAIHLYLTHVIVDNNPNTVPFSTLQSLLHELLKAMVYKGWTIEHIHDYLKVMAHAALRSFWEEHAKSLFSPYALVYGLHYSNESVLTWAMEQCWSCRSGNSVDCLKLLIKVHAQNEATRDCVLTFFGLSS